MRRPIHPSFQELNRLADRELDEERQLEVHRHLGTCQRCRDEISLIRDLGRTAREISHPSAPEDALTRILERRAAGDRVILPVSTPPPSTRRRRAIGIAAGIGGTLLAATLLLLPASEASAGASALRMDPAQPEPGDRIEITYVPASALAGEDVLFLRGAFRRPGDAVPRRGLPGAVRLELHPAPDGTFSGTLQMPIDAAFGYFAVENRSASEIDVGGGRFWAILAHADGKPTREALREQLQLVGPNDVDFGLTAAGMLLKHYPDDEVGANRRLSYEMMSAIGMRHDSLRVERAHLLQQLSLTDSTAAARISLEAELEDEDLGRQLEILEREWVRAGLSDDYIVARAFWLAVKGQNPESVLRWARRHNRVRPDEVGVIAEALARFPSLRETAKDGIRTDIERLETASDTRRGLAETADELRARDGQRIRQLLGTLGRLLFEDELYEAAIDTLELAVGEGWNPAAFTALAEAYAAVGDTSEALALYAYVTAGEAEPEARIALERSLRNRFGSRVGGEAAWSRRVAESQLQIDRRRIAEARAPVRPSGRPVVWSRDNVSRPLVSLHEGDVAIIVFWAGPPVRLSAALRGDPSGPDEPVSTDVRVITITENRPSGELDGLLRKEGLTLPVFYDRNWEAARSLNSLGLPYFYVVDRQGRFVLVEDMARAVRLAESLRRAASTAA